MISAANLWIATSQNFTVQVNKNNKYVWNVQYSCCNVALLSFVRYITSNRLLIKGKVPMFTHSWLLCRKSEKKCPILSSFRGTIPRPIWHGFLEGPERDWTPVVHTITSLLTHPLPAVLFICLILFTPLLLHPDTARVLNPSPCFRLPFVRNFNHNSCSPS